MKIFLSHSSRDKPFVRELISYLPSFISHWLDEEQLLFGMDLPMSLQSAVSEESDFVILFLSQEAVQSKWVQKELTWAMEREQRIGRVFVLPVVLADEAWKIVRPAKFRRRKHLTCKSFTEAAIKALADEIRDELLGWLIHFYDQRTVASERSAAEVSIAGKWQSLFTWDPHYPDDPGRSEDTIEVSQVGSTFIGKSVSGNYRYKFDGRIVAEYVVGEWESELLPLFGVFQLRLNIDTGAAADGYWIGNGTSAPYHGEWHWQRVQGKNTASRRRSLK